MQDCKLAPIATLEFSDAGEFERDKDFVFSFEFDILPTFDLPNYEGLEIECRSKHQFTQREREEYYHRFAEQYTKIVPNNSGEFPKTGQQVVIDFTTYKDNKIDYNYTNKEIPITLGTKFSLPGVEEIIRTMKVGDVREASITFPDNFFNEKLQGQTRKVRIKLHAINDFVVPPLSDEIAHDKNLADVEELKLRLNVAQDDVYNANYRDEVTNALATRLLKLVDFLLPESLVKLQINSMISDYKTRLIYRGRSVTDEIVEQLKTNFRNEAEATVRRQILFMAVATHAGQTASDREVQARILETALSNGVDYNELRRLYDENGFYFLLANEVLADKGRDVIFSRANIKIVEPGQPAATPEATAQAQAQPQQDNEIHYYQPPAAEESTQASAANAEPNNQETQAESDTTNPSA